MKTIIIYTTSHGCTGKVVKELSQKLSGEVLTVDIRQHQAPPLSEFDVDPFGFADYLNFKIRSFGKSFIRIKLLIFGAQMIVSEHTYPGSLPCLILRRIVTTEGFIRILCTFSGRGKSTCKRGLLTV